MLVDALVNRVGGRLSNAHKTKTFGCQQPILIPKNHPLTEAIIRYFHVYNLHAGLEIVLFSIRQNFWIPDGRLTVKKQLRKCIRCIRIST